MTIYLQRDRDRERGPTLSEDILSWSLYAYFVADTPQDLFHHLVWHLENVAAFGNLWHRHFLRPAHGVGPMYITLNSRAASDLVT